MPVQMHPCSLLRTIAQSVRHAPVLQHCTSAWNVLRQPYGRVLTAFAAGNGLPLSIGGHTMRLHPLFANLNWETVEVEAYRAFTSAVMPGDVVYDVGSHFGTYTIISLRQGGPQTRVVAYEPCELTRQYLSQHLQWNHATEQVLVRSVCCGAVKGIAPFYIRPGVPEGINSLIKAEELEEISVDVTTLDDDVRELGLIPQIIKIDVEGAELEVLKGAEAVLRNCRPRLFISLHPIPLAKVGLAPRSIVDWLARRDYDCRMIAEDQELHLMATSD